MNKKIIAILGQKNNGKDTISNYIADEYNFTKIALADPLKEMCRIAFGFNDEQLYGNKKEIVDDFWKTTPRKIFQYLGTDIFMYDIQKIMPHLQDNYWNIALAKKISETNGNVVVSDIRFANDAKVIRKSKGIVIKVIRNTVKSTDLHVSERGDIVQEYDYLIHNDGSLQELYKKVDHIMGKLKIKK